MGTRRYKLATPSRCGTSAANLAEITRSKSEKSLLYPLHKTDGRNNVGRITIRHKGGGHKRQYRVIDFRGWDKDGVPAKVAYIEYDPNRTAHITLLHYVDGEKCYIATPKSLCQGDFVENGPDADIKPGNDLPLRNIPVGTTVYCVGLRPLGGAEIGRSAGTSVQLVVREGKYTQLRTSSGGVRNVDPRCRTFVGEVGNAEQSNINRGKADRRRWKNVCPTIRGVVMNPVGHPYGGGEGKASGDRHPINPWGKPEGRTRRPKKANDKLTVCRHKTGSKR